MRFLYFTDSHITAKNPASRIDNIQETIKNKLNDVKDIISNESVDVVLHGGDLFHTPDISNKFAGEVVDILRSFKCPMYVVPGNHDLFGHNIETLENTKLGLLSKAGVITILDRKSPLTFNDNGVIIGVEGQEYYSDIDADPLKDYMVSNLNVDYSILVIHSMLLDHEFFNGIKHTQLKDVQTAADLVLAGHYHPGFKEYSNGLTTFLNPGSFLRVDSSIGSYNYTPSVIIIDVDKDGITHKVIPLPSAKKAEDVFKQNKNTNKSIKSIEELNQKIKQAKLKGVTVDSLLDEYANKYKEESPFVYNVKYLLNNIETSTSVDNGYVDSLNNVYIETVELFNFQAHKHLKVDFNKGLNVIVGESNSGKTSILRAIKWVFYDKPSGSGFIRSGSKKSRVIVHLSNGYAIERSRSKSSSGVYILHNPDGTLVEFTGFSNNIPIEITNAHQSPEITINGVKYRINISDQLDPAFLISNSPTEKSSLIGALVGTEQADLLKKQLLGDKKQRMIEINKLKSLRDEVDEKLESFDNLKAFEKTVLVLDAAIEKHELMSTKLQNLIILNNKYKKVAQSYKEVSNSINNLTIPDKNDVDKLKEVLTKLEHLTKLRDDYIRKDKLMENLIDLSDKLDDLSSIRSMYEELSEKVDNLRMIKDLRDNFNSLSSLNFDFKYDLDNIKELYSSLKDSLNKLYKLDSVRSNYNNLIKEAENIENNLNDNKKVLQNLLNEKNDRLSKLKGQRCEACGQIIEDISHFV